MSAPHRNLHAVPEPEQEDRNAPTGTPWWAWLALVGFLSCAAGWYASQRSAAGLEAELAASRTELANTQAELRVTERHLATVGERSGTLAGDLEALAADARLLAEDALRDPRAPAAEAPPAP